MKFSVFVLCLIAAVATSDVHGCEDQNSMTYVDEVVVLKKIFSQLNNLKSGIDQCNSRNEENCNTEIVVPDTSVFDIRYDAFPERCKTKTLPKNCAEATACIKRSGIYRILLEKYSTEPFLVECDVKTDGGSWTLVQRRQDGSEDFYLDWADYKRGFGQIDGEFFIGLDKLHALTSYNGPQELLVLLEDKGETRKAFYSNFVVGGESDSFPLKSVGVYSGNAGDSLTFHMGAKFTTKDVDNDTFEGNCAQLYTGAWWHKECHISNLNGKYGDNNYAKGITWQTFRGYNVSTQHATMMIRRRPY